MERIKVSKKDIIFNDCGELDVEKSKLPWIYFDNNNNMKVNTTLLAKYILYGVYEETKENIVEYLQVPVKKMSSFYIYDYEVGIWRMVTEPFFKGYIYKFIPAEIRNNRLKSELWSEVIENTNFKRIHNFDDFNSGLDDYINFQDGMLNIKTKELLPHSSKYLSTIQIPCKYKEILESKGEAPVFNKYMADLCDGKEDYKRLLLEFCGAVISNLPGDVIKKILIMKGKGDTGKSKLRSLIEYLIGKGNSHPVQISQLNEKYEVGYLYGKRLVGHGEASDKVASNLDTFKALTGGDQVSSARKFDEPIDFVFKGFFWYNSNFFIKFGGDRGDWVYNRLIIMEFNNVIPEKKRDKHILDKMKKEKNGIMYQILQYLYMFVDNNLQFHLNADLPGLLRQCKMENSPVLQFIEAVFDKTEKLSKEKTMRSAIYFKYQKWCEANKIPAKSKQNFYKELEESLSDEDGSFFCNVHGTLYLRKYKFNQEKFEKEININETTNRWLTDDEVYESEYGPEKAAAKKIVDMAKEKYKIEQKKQQEKADNINKILDKNMKYDDYFGKIGD